MNIVHSSALLACLTLAGALGLAVAPGPARARPKPKTHDQRYDLSVLGMNDGDPFRLQGAEAEAILLDPTAEVFVFQSTDWMAKVQRGVWVKVRDLIERFPERTPTELFRVYRLDFPQDRASHALIVATPALGEQQLRAAPSMLRIGPDGLSSLWAATTLPGQRFRVVDIRDLNRDQVPEVLLSGEGGRSGYYQFMELIGLAKDGWTALDAPQIESLHFVDLDRNGESEVVVRERVGRRGPAYQWTYIDHLYRWNGARFEPADARFPRYHDEQTLPTLIGDLLDNHTARKPILDEKLAAMARVREIMTPWWTAPAGFHANKIQALAQLQKRNFKAATTRLEALDRSFAYDPQVLIGLAQVRDRAHAWDQLLDTALRAVALAPTNREAWWWAGVGFSAVQERSSAIASLHLAVRLSGPRDEGVAFLQARRDAPGVDPELRSVIEQALALTLRDE